MGASPTSKWSVKKAPRLWGTEIMKHIDCPGIGPRPLVEFVYGGEVRKPPVSEVSREELADTVFNRSGAPGVVREWWYHRPTGNWYVLERNTLTDTVVRAVNPEEVAYAIPML